MIQRGLFLVLLTLASALPAPAQQLLSPEASARAISLTEAELPQGVALVTEVTHVFQVSPSEDYIGLLQDFDLQTGDGLLVVTCIYGAFQTKEEAAYAFHSMRVSDRFPRVELDDIGDNVFGRLPGTTCFLQDRAVVFLKIERGVGYNVESDAQIEEIRDEFLSRIIRKLDAQGYTKSTPINLELETISGEVNGANSAQWKLTSDVNPSLYPLTFEASIVHDGEVVYRFEKVSSTNGGAVSFSWNGTDQSTAPIEPGGYEFWAGVTDIYGRSVSRQEVVVVSSDSGNSPLEFLSVRDLALSQRFDHQNDGSNLSLILEKIQGKATRNAVAFDVTGTNLEGLSRATLVLTIDSSQAVNGWGNGRTISVQAITQPWEEGNGWHFGLKKKDQIAGDGSGATWFSPVDEDISNDSANSVINWNGATNSVYPPTAPAVQITNFQSGEVTFDVTADVLNGAENGWLILKDQENVGSKVSFYSREGAAAAGNPDFAPRLILEFGSPVASATPSKSLLAKFGFGSIVTKLRPSRGSSELRSVREILQDSPIVALAAEQLLYEATRTNPVLNMTARTAYRSWLAEDLRVAAAPVWVG